MKKYIHITIFLTMAFASANAFSAENFSTIPEDKREYKRSEEAVKKLDENAYKVTQESETERPFHNEFWNFWEAGIYVDVVSGEPLFSSTDKIRANHGWPAFTKPISENFIAKKQDNSYGMERTEVRSKNADSHLGHVFNDGPIETGGRRYCINSSALRFVPKDKLLEQGYAPYLFLFSPPAEKK